jgi:hypothetical protein
MIQSASEPVFPDTQDEGSYAGRRRYGQSVEPLPRRETPGDLVRAIFSYPLVSDRLHLLGDDAISRFRTSSDGRGGAPRYRHRAHRRWYLRRGARKSLWAPGLELLKAAFNPAIHLFLPDTTRSTLPRSLQANSGCAGGPS